MVVTICLLSKGRDAIPLDDRKCGPLAICLNNPCIPQSSVSRLDLSFLSAFYTAMMASMARYAYTASGLVGQQHILAVVALDKYRVIGPNCHLRETARVGLWQ